MKLADEERVVDAPHLPDPQTVACFSVHADEHRLLLRYYCGDAQEPDIAIIFFPSYDTFKFGQPNDEALHGHPLYAKGLSFYRAQEVLNSSWIAELERQNSVHVGHNREGFLRGTASRVCARAQTPGVPAWRRESARGRQDRGNGRVP